MIPSRPALLLLCAVGCAHPQAHLRFEALIPLPSPALRTEITAKQLARACDEAMDNSDGRLAALVAVPDDERTFSNSFNELEQTSAEYAEATTRLTFLKDIHPDAKVRAAASECEAHAGTYAVEVGARADLFKALKAALTHRAEWTGLDAEDQRLIELTMRDFHRNGLDLPEAQRKELVSIRSQLAEIATRYEANLDENSDTVEATAEELEGVSPDLIQRLKRAANGKLLIATQYPDYYPVMENAKSEGLRHRMEVAMDSREAQRNIPLLTRALNLRDRAAHLLGYASHADFVTEDRMAKNAKTVGDFLARLREELKPGRDALNAQMQALKAADTHDPGAVLQSWDFRYYLARIREREFAIDAEKVRAYFPADKVLRRMFEIYAKLFHVTFEPVAGAAVWAPGVTLYEVHDTPGGRMLAHFYVDLFPRPGKYGHAASFPIAAAREVRDGYQLPLDVLVVNFNPPAEGKPSHLSVDEVEVLFHEFGHVVHMALTTSRFASLGGANVSVDFAEAPSQMLENWVYQPEILALLTEDPADPAKPMPAELAQRLAAGRTYDAGIRYTRQVYLATLDQLLHTRGGEVNPDAVEQQVWKDIMGYPSDPHEHPAASFGHLMNGYDAGYYGYLWSKVFADDMFTRFAKEGVLNPDTGRAYRDAILAKGRTEEPDVLIARFLGRAPNEAAFLHLLGIAPREQGSAPSQAH